MIFNLLANLRGSTILHLNWWCTMWCCCIVIISPHLFSMVGWQSIFSYHGYSWLQQQTQCPFLKIWLFLGHTLYRGGTRLSYHCITICREVLHLSTLQQIKINYQLSSKITKHSKKFVMKCWPWTDIIRLERGFHDSTLWCLFCLRPHNSFKL